MDTQFQTPWGIHEEEAPNESIVAILFQPIIKLMKISGIFIQSRSISKAGVIWHFSRWFYCVLLACMFLADAIRFMLVYKTEEYHQFSNRTMGVFSLTVYMWVMPIMSFGNLYILTKHVPRIIHAVNAYETLYDFDLDKMALNRKRKLTVYSTSIHIVMSTVLVATTLTLLPQKSVFMAILVDFQYEDYSQKIIPILFMCFKSIILSIATSATSGFQHWMMQLIRCEYNKVTRRLTNFKQETSVQDMEEHVEGLGKQHEALTALLQTTNPVLQFEVLLSYASGIPVICFLLYGLADGGLGILDIMILLTLFLGAVVRILYSTLMGAMLSSKAHEIRDVLFQLDMNRLSEKTIRQVDIFVARVNGPTIGISVYDLFIVDGSTILMLFGTILTYSIVVFQTTGPTDCSCNNDAIVSTISPENMTTLVT